MDRRTALRTLAAGSLAAPAILKGRYRLFAQSPQEYSARTVRLVSEEPVVDLLCQFRFPDLRGEEPSRDTRWLSDPSSFTDEDWAEYRDSGVDVIALGRGAPSRAEQIEFCARWNGFIATHSERFTRIDTADDFDTIRDSGKVGILISSQNAEHFETVDDVELFHGLGERVTQLTYNFQNRIGAGFLEHDDGGLTVFGHRIVERMQEVGIAVDLSHCADRTTMDALDAATKPVVFSHATPRGLLPGFQRCKTDDAIRRLAAGGGVMGIAFIRFMIRSEPPVTVEHVVDHFDYVARLVGVEHVGIGSDLDLQGWGMPRTPPGGAGPADQPNFERYNAFFREDGAVNIAGLDHSRRVFDLTEALIRRGWGDDEIALVLGGNWVRVLSDIWG